MIYTFKSKAAADIIMLEANGNALLDLLGKRAAKGIITADQAAGAEATIMAAIAAEEAAQALAEREAKAEGRTLAAPGVTLRTRCFPFVEMLKAAQKHGKDVVWGV